MDNEEGSSTAIVNASREEDDICIPKHIENKIKRRLQMTWGGGIVAFSGSIVAIIALFREPVQIELVIIGMVSALVGAGSVDPSTVINFFKRGN